MSDPNPGPGHGDDSQDWLPPDHAPKNGHYEVIDRRNGRRLGIKYFNRGERFGGWPGCDDSHVIWSTEPVRPPHDDTIPAL
jgi:hypothetical protein